MSDTEERTIPISTLRRRRGVVKASLKRLAARLTELEARSHEPTTPSHAHKLSSKLESLDSEFKTHHYSVIDAIPDDDRADDNLAKEQEELDQHDSNITDLSLRLENLLRECSAKSESAPHKIALRSLTNLRERLNVILSALSKLSGTPEEVHLVEQYQEQISDLKKELSDTRQTILSSCTAEESDVLINTTIVDIDKMFFEIGLNLKKLSVKTSPVCDASSAESPSPDSKLIKLPKLDIPTFDGNILHWLAFWEQYRVAIHDRSNLSLA